VQAEPWRSDYEPHAIGGKNKLPSTVFAVDVTELRNCTRGFVEYSGTLAFLDVDEIFWRSVGHCSPALRASAAIMAAASAVSGKVMMLHIASLGGDGGAVLGGRGGHDATLILKTSAGVKQRSAAMGF
jgi:hypothetical protein